MRIFASSSTKRVKEDRPDGLLSRGLNRNQHEDVKEPDVSLAQTRKMCSWDGFTMISIESTPIG